MQFTTDSSQARLQQDRYSYLMMFCALMMVRNSRASLHSALELLPLSPRVSGLADQLAQQSAESDLGSSGN